MNTQFKQLLPHMDNSQAYDKLYSAFLVHQQKISYYIWGARAYATFGVCLFGFLCFLLFKKTKTLNKEFTRALFYSLLFPTLLSFYAGCIFTPICIIPFDVLLNFGLFRFTTATHVESIFCSVFCVPYIMSLIYLGIIYLKAFFTTSRLHIGKGIKLFLGSITGGVILIGWLMTYSELGYKQGEKRQLVLDADPRTRVIFEEYGCFIVNMKNASPLMIISLIIMILEGAVGIVFVTLLVAKVFYTLLTRRFTVSKGTHSLQIMLFKVFLLHIIIFVTSYGLPITIMFFAICLRMDFLTSFPLCELFLLNVCQMPTLYCISYLYFVNPIKKAFIQMIQGKRGIRRVSQATTKEYTESKI